MQPDAFKWLILSDKLKCMQ